MGKLRNILSSLLMAIFLIAINSNSTITHRCCCSCISDVDDSSTIQLATLEHGCNAPINNIQLSDIIKVGSVENSENKIAAIYATDLIGYLSRRANHNDDIAEQSKLTIQIFEWKEFDTYKGYNPSVELLRAPPLFA